MEIVRLLKNKKLFSLLFFNLSIFASSQIIVKNSNNLALDSVSVVRNGRFVPLKTGEFSKFIFKENDHVLLNNKSVSYYYENDTLLIFDQEIVIDEIQLVRKEVKRREAKSKSSVAMSAATFMPNNKYATLISPKKSTREFNFIKSFKLIPVYQPLVSYTDEDRLEVEILGVTNGLPDDGNKILTFSIEFDKFKRNNWELTFPKVVKCPEEGVFIVFTPILRGIHKTGFALQKNSKIFSYYPAKGWQEMEMNGYAYQLKILK